MGIVKRQDNPVAWPIIIYRPAGGKQVKGCKPQIKNPKGGDQMKYSKIPEINNKFLSGESVRAGGTELTGQLEQERIKEQDIITRKFLSGKFATPEAKARFLYGVEHGSVTEMPSIKGRLL